MAGVGRTRALSIGAVVVMAAVAVAVMAAPGEEPPGASTLAGEPLPMSAEPLFTGPTDVSSAEGDGDVLLFRHGNQHLTVVDATTGARLWDEQDFGDAVYQESAPDGFAPRQLLRAGILVEYRAQTDCAHPDRPPAQRGSCTPAPDDETGLMLLSRKDGSIIWQVPVTTPAPPAWDPQRLLRAADDRVAVVTVARSSAPHTIGYDVRTGRQLWERTGGTWAAQLAGDTLLSATSSDGPTTTVLASDARTGEPLWDMAAELVESAGKVAVLRVGTDALVVSAATGRELSRFPAEPAYLGCESDQRSTIACGGGPVRDGGRLELATVDGAGKVTRFPADGGVWNGVWAGRVFVDTKSGTYTVDSSGHRTGRPGRLPGRLVLLTENRAVFTQTQRSDEAQVYEVDTRAVN